jgi:hypothetical protein
MSPFLALNSSVSTSAFLIIQVIMVLQVQPADVADAVRSVEIESLAYGPNPIGPILFPNPTGDSSTRAQADDLVQQRESDSASRWVKVVDTELVEQGLDGMIAFSYWYVWDKPQAGGFRRPAERGARSNAEACNLFFGGMDEKKHARFGDQPHVCESHHLP